MRRRALTTGIAISAAAALAFAAAPAIAHDDTEWIDDGVLDSGKETHYHHEHDQQHGEEQGHLDEILDDNVDVIGKLDLFAGEEQPGRIADVSAYGDYAYLTAFWEPECDRGGVYIVDISDPENPEFVSLIPSHQGTFSGEGSQVIDLETPYFSGQVLAYQNEICPGATNGVGGITLVDVTNPKYPKKLVEGAGDFTYSGPSEGKAQTKANETHSVRMWTDDGKAYAVLVDDEEDTDIDILDITNPSKPKLISETSLDADTAQPVGAVHGDAVFLHDMVVEEVDGIMTMLVSYWDGGYAMLDVDDPANPEFIADTDFAAADPVRAQFGQTISPEGNAHQAEFTKDREYFIATDEDFDPYRVTATMADGTEFTAIQGSDVPAIDADTSLTGNTRYLGLACSTAGLPTATPGEIAVIERGVCDFTVKVQAAQSLGYAGAVVFNRTGVDGCDTLISMLVEADIPAVFVSRTDGFRILTGGVPDGYTCSDSGAGTAVTTAIGAAGQAVDIKAIFDGWGYVHLYGTAPGPDGKLPELDQYWVDESQDPAFASGFGDLSVHEVATDPDEELAYISYYAAGFRVVSYAGGQLEEVGSFIDEGGNNFWGVEVHELGGEKYVLASDRDSGLYIFQYDPEG
jgi:hypothetical protein